MTVSFRGNNTNTTQFRVQNEVLWQKVSEKNTQYIEISQNQPNLGHFVVLGFWDSKVQKIKEVTKSTQNYPIYVTGIISAKNFQKNTLFAIVAFLLCKSSNQKKTMLRLLIIQCMYNARDTRWTAGKHDIPIHVNNRWSVIGIGPIM